MKEKIFESMYREATDFWWARSRRELVIGLWRRYRGSVGADRPRVLDVGCGTGELLLDLQDEAEVHGVEVSEAAREFCRKRGLESVHAFDAESQTLTSLFDGKFDLIVALDVLEHVERDQDLVAQIREMLAPDGLMILTVPAFQTLWSRRDEDLGHKRRYRTAGIRTLFDDVGWRRLKLTYYLFFLFPVLWVSVRLKRRQLPAPTWMGSDMPTFSKLSSALLYGLMRVENFWVTRVGFPFGISIVAAFQRREIPEEGQSS